MTPSASSLADGQPVVFDVDESSFERLVLERSQSVPVLVDFWAPWCGPCKTLGPLLETLAREAEGRWVLAKVDTDACPTLAQHFGIRGIPNVKAIWKGRLIDEFTGALPRAEVEAFLAGIVPSEEDERVVGAERLTAAGETGAARDELEAVLAVAPRHERAALALAELAEAEGATDEATRLIANLVETGELGERVRVLRAKLAFDEPVGASLDELTARVEADPKDLEARLELGRAAAQAGDHDLAGEQFLAVIERDAAFRNGEAQQALRDLMALMGEADPRTDAFRRRMASALFA